MLALPFLLGTLFVRVSPVIYLFFDEFARIDCSEGSTREVQISIGSKWHHILIVIVQSLTCCKLLFVFILRIIEFLGMIAPGTIVIFVQNDTVPVDSMSPFIFQFDTAYFVFAQKVLEGSKAHEWFILINIIVRFSTV